MAELVYICYRDHVLFRTSEAELIRPAIRECVGWIHRENDDAILVVWDRGIAPLEHEKVQSESGLLILKANILEMKTIDM